MRVCVKVMIVGTALGGIALWGRNRVGAGVFGGSSVPANVNINGVDAMNGYSTTGTRCSGPNAWEAWQKGCEDTLALQKGLYDWALVQQNQRFQDRQTLDSEFFSLYKSQVDADFGL